MRARSLLAVLAVAALGLTACGGSSEGTSDKSLTMVLGADPGNLDPHFTSLSVTYQVDSFLYDSLVNIDKNGKLVPGLAQKWKGSTTKATFTLRKGVTCSDGTSLTASTVAQNINFVGDPKNESSRIGVFVPPGAKATANDKARTVTVTVPSPDAFLARSVGRLQIVCKKGMKDRSMLKRGADGTGMFTLTDAVPGDHYTLTRRTDYAWGPHGSGDDEAALPDTLVLKVVTNEATSANLMLSGGANIARFVGPDQKRLKTQGLFERDNAQPTGVLWFNEASGHPGADESVRRALTQALDLDQAGKAITSG
ncbi:MAG: ABC transporter substrate-binding protein, partial [Nocardioidaceae bacterium]